MLGSRTVVFSGSVLSNSLRAHGQQHARLPGVWSNSCPLNQWCHPTISSSVVPFSSRLQSFPASGSFPISLSLHQVVKYWSTGASASASVLPMNIQYWFPLELTGLISCSPGDSQESCLAPQFKGIDSSVLCLLYGPTLTSVHHYWKNYSFDCKDLCWQSDIFAF